MEKFKDEAVKRMELLKMSKQCIEAFKNGKVWESEGIGASYEINEEVQKLVDEFQKENGGLVYHIIHTYSNIGEMYSMLYVSKYKTEWKSDREDIKEGYAISYVYNKDAIDCSELGSIGIRSSIGGLVRTY